MISVILIKAKCERQSMVINFDTIGPTSPNLLPSRPLRGCPAGTEEGITTCFCQDHCSWAVCRMKNPPENCPKVESWIWDYNNMYWTAQSNNY